jgi:hypothetical protein
MPLPRACGMAGVTAQCWPPPPQAVAAAWPPGAPPASAQPPRSPSAASGACLCLCLCRCRCLTSRQSQPRKGGVGGSFMGFSKLCSSAACELDRCHGHQLWNWRL